MIPLRIYLKGFMSYREEAELVFDGAPLWMLSGPNGAGKSAIFDAMTYALYGTYRGGTHGARDLINHGSSGLVVEFDFAVNGAIYRVKRTLARKGQPSRQVVCLDAPALRTVPETETEGGFDNWVRRTLGLDARAFTASVLLCQGKADALLESGARDRHAILSQIVELTAYERLARRADERHKNAKAKVEVYSSQLVDLAEVATGEIEALEDEVARLGSQIAEAQDERIRLAALTQTAVRWEALESEHVQMKQAIVVPGNWTRKEEAVR